MATGAAADVVSVAEALVVGELLPEVEVDSVDDVGPDEDVLVSVSVSVSVSVDDSVSVLSLLLSLNPNNRRKKETTGLSCWAVGTDVLGAATFAAVVTSVVVTSVVVTSVVVVGTAVVVGVEVSDDVVRVAEVVGTSSSVPSSSVPSSSVPSSSVPSSSVPSSSVPSSSVSSSSASSSAWLPVVFGVLDELDDADLLGDAVPLVEFAVEREVGDWLSAAATPGTLTDSASESDEGERRPGAEWAALLGPERSAEALP